MRKRERYPVQVDKNDHEKLKDLVSDTGLTMGIIVHKLLKSVTERVSMASEVPKDTFLPKFFVFELLHLRDVGVITDKEMKILLTNKGSEGIVMDIAWADDLREKREIIDRYDITNNILV